MTWAARVALGGVGVAAAPHALPLPRQISRPSRLPPSSSVPPSKEPTSIGPPSSATSRPSVPNLNKPPSTESLHIPEDSVPSSLSNGDAATPLSPSPQTSGPTHSPPRRCRATTASLPPRRLRGLINGGNCCFINVVLQALLACSPFRQLLNACENAPAGSLLQKFVRLAREMNATQFANGHSPPVSFSRNPNGYAHGQNGKAGILNPLALKDGALLREEPLLADWFYDVFPSSGSVGGNVSETANGVLINNGGSAGGSQEDAEEFLSFVLNALHEELVARNGNGVQKTANGISHPSIQTINGRIHTVKGPSENRLTQDDDGWTEMTRNGKSVEIRGGEFAQSGITDIFGGALRSEVNRARAKPSVTREPFFSLSLDIESGMIRDVEHAFCAYFEPEYLEGYTMEGTKGLAVDARKQVLLMQTPQVLILHLKRFSHNSVTGALNKVSRDLAFPEILRVPGKVMHNPASRWGADACKTYELTAVVTHLGKELAGGHYTADVRWEGEDGECAWFLCDDSKVVRTNLQKVCRREAYLLFYSAVCPV